MGIRRLTVRRHALRGGRSARDRPDTVLNERDCAREVLLRAYEQARAAGYRPGSPQMHRLAEAERKHDLALRRVRSTY